MSDLLIKKKRHFQFFLISTLALTTYVFACFSFSSSLFRLLINLSMMLRLIAFSSSLFRLSLTCTYLRPETFSSSLFRPFSRILCLTWAAFQFFLISTAKKQFVITTSQSFSSSLFRPATDFNQIRRARLSVLPYFDMKEN